MIGLLRVKNEARWIVRCIESIQTVVSRVIVMDDHSDDCTGYFCAKMPGVQVFESPYYGLNETRDKNHLLDIARQQREEWALMIDGDEMLEPSAADEILAIEASNAFPAASLRVRYLWNDAKTIRVDGIYSNFRRPSMFRIGNYNFEPTPHGGNFHCGNAPLAVQMQAAQLSGSLLHFGYMEAADRRRKYDWYNKQDPDNILEDRYRHMVIGDIFPADSRFRHAGPLRLEPLCTEHST